MVELIITDIIMIDTLKLPKILQYVFNSKKKYIIKYNMFCLTNIKFIHLLKNFGKIMYEYIILYYNTYLKLVQVYDFFFI